MKICVVSYKFGTVEEIGLHLGVYNYLITELNTLSEKVEGIKVVAPWFSFGKKGSVQVGKLEVVRTYPGMLYSWKWFLLRRLFQKLYIYTTYRKLLKLYKEEKFDLIYVWQARESCIAALNFKKRANVPVIFHQIGPWHWHLQNLNKPGVKNFIKRIIADAKTQQKYIDRIYQETDQIIFPSRALQKEIINLGYKNLNTAVVPLAVDHHILKSGIDTQEIRKGLDLQNKKVLIFIGRIVFYEKGLNYLLEAVKILKTQGQKNFKLIIIGGGETSEINKLKRQINNLDISNFVLYLGKIPNNNLPAYLNLADISLVPSIWFEIFGRVIIEALSCGRPVICSDLGGMAEVNIDQQTGLVVPAKNAAVLAGSIQKLLNDNLLREKFGKAGRKRVESYYTYEAVANQLINVFQKVII